MAAGISHRHPVAVAVAAALGASAAAPHAAAAPQLPVPCAGAACSANGGPASWVTSGSATGVQVGNSFTVNQSTASATLNWQSFNISAGGKVSFVQPSSGAVALNRIYQSSPSQIFGALNSNGTVYLLNPNGILFGAGSVVNVGGLLASSLDLSQAALTRGIAGAGTTQAGPNQPLPGPALQPYADQTVNNGSVTVAAGASITANQGQILLFAPTVTNSGTLSSPGGQTILGAGQEIFLASSTDPNIRGLLIEVGGCGSATPAQCGTVTNTAANAAGAGLGQIVANTGNVTLAGVAVNQDGRVSATTSVRANGSIRLQARSTDQSVSNTAFGALPDVSGTLTLGPSSETSVSLEGSATDKTVDVNAQPKSQIEMFGGQIDLLANAAVTAPSGDVTLTALTNPQTLFTNPTTTADSSRIYLAPGSTIDVSGVTVSEPVSDNSLAVQLRGSELEDFPQQRSGPLRGQTVYVDLRQHGTNSDGSTWVGTPIADLAGDVSAIQRDVFQRNLSGGNIQFNAGGSVIVSAGATLDVSGGQIDWQAGYVKSSLLVAPNGGVTPISQANPTVAYLGTVDSISQGDPHWGSVSTVTLPGIDPRGTYQAAYVEGKDAGSVSIVAPAVVLDGTISAHTVSGPLQVNPTTNFAANPYYPGDVYRFPDEVPLGGTLTLGNSAVLAAGSLSLGPAPVPRAVFDSLTFGNGAVLPSLQGPNGAAFDPESDPLPNGFVSELRPDLFGPGKITQLNVYAEGSISVPAGVTLAPGDGGAVTLVAGNLDFAGSLSAAGGSATLVAVPTVLLGGAAGGCTAAVCAPTALTLAPTATIDLRGAWVNNPLSADPTQLPPLYINGGTASIVSAAGGALTIATGARIDVSGGAERTLTGSLVDGRGGSISIAAEPSRLIDVSGGIAVSDNPTTVTLPASLTGNLAGFALAEGGSLSLTLPNLCVSAAACPDPTAYRVDPAILTSLGFSSVALGAAPDPTESGGLLIAGDLNLDLSQRNLVFLPGALAAPSGTLAGITQVATLPEYLRQPENLTLTADAPKQNGPTFRFADVSISPSATLAFDPGATLSVASNSRVFVDGKITAPAGEVAIAIRNDIVDTSVNAPYLIPDQAIWLGPTSLIDVSGTTVLTPNSNGLLLGKVLGGGSVNISAQRGYLIGSPGSEILAGGTSGTLDLRPPGNGPYTRQTVASPGGSIMLSASEGFQLDGVVAAPAGGAGVAGGSLSLVLDGNTARGSDPLFSTNPSDPVAVANAPRVLTVTDTELPVVIAEGTNIPNALDGVGQISATQINAGGFANVALSARDLTTTNFTGLVFLEPGSVNFAGNVSLAPAESLVINAGQLSASSGSVQLASSYVRLGSGDTSSQALDTTAQAGKATLAVTANLIDLVGVESLSGFATASLSSSGDLRLSGVQLDENGIGGSLLAGFNGQLISPGPLALTAQQIYPTTLTNYTIQLTGQTPAESALTLGRAPGTAGTVLSAAGSVTLEATEIDDAGVLKAPIGTISLQGQSVTLDSNAVLSVSAAGTTIPFGQTQGGFDWVYALRQSGAATTVYGTGAGDTAVPGKQITVTAGSFQFDKGAIIDTAGGGDLSAYEWIPGLGGTKDVLSPTQSPGLYAVLPGLTLPFAPVDPNEDRGFTTAPGSSVYLAGGGGLPAGTYALLPARYGLLPGAYLVKAVAGYTDLTAGQSLPQFDGSTIVSGYFLNAVTGLRSNSVASGFDVVSGAYALAPTSPYTLAQYNLSSANAFFAQQAQTNNVATPRLPADAGDLAIAVTNAAQLEGTLQAGAPAGYRAGTVDITANDLFVTSNPADAPAGAVVLNVGQLDALGAESLLLGATRTSLNGYTQLNVPESGSGNVVEIDSGASLTAPEVILAGSQAVRLDPGADVTAAGTALAAEPDLLAPTGTAVVRVSTGPQVALNPQAAVASIGVPGTGLVGAVSVAAGASLSAPGSLSIDAGGSVEYAGGLSASGAAVRLGGEQIALGAAPASFTGFLIAPSLLQGLSGTDLTLEVTNPTAADYASRPIEIFGPVQLALADFTVNAPGLFAATADAGLTVTAPNITLGSGAAQSYTPGASGTAALSLSAAHVVLSGGTFGASGFSTTTLSASRDLTLEGDGVLGVSGGLTVSSPIVQSAAGKTYQMLAAGDLVTEGSGSSAPSSASGPGGELDLTGAAVTLGGHIVLPGGRITATASGGLTVAPGAVLDVSGFSESFAGESRSAPGGTIELTAGGGDLTQSAGSLLDVSSGTGDASGGTLALLAPEGRVSLAGSVRGAGGADAEGGTLSVEAQQLDFAGLVGLAGTDGFSGAVRLHERGPGSFALSSGTLHAADVELTADQGAITIGSGAAVDARSTQGGKIVLAAQSIDLAGSLLAGSSSLADRGGTVELLSGGALTLDSGSLISVGGAGGSAAAQSAGTVWLRAPQAVVASVTGGGPVQLELGGSVTGAGQISLEAYHAPYVLTGTSLDPTTAQWYADAADFMTNQAPAVMAALTASPGIASQAAFRLLPGIEIDAPGDLHVISPWDLSTERFGANSVPGVLTIRSGGSLYVDNSISDGFTGGVLSSAGTGSWSYRLAAGANLGSSNPLAVVAPTELGTTGADSGSIILAPGVPDAHSQLVVRTGTGSIDLAAAGDLRLGNQASVIYTAGAQGPSNFATSRDGTFYLAQGGGSVTVSVGRDIVGAPSDQLFADWLFRSGLNPSNPRGGFQPTAWGISYDNFEQGIGALGGGDLTISAGRNIIDLGADVPSIGVPVGTAHSATTVEENAGMLSIESGGNILGGKFLDMAGVASVVAGGAVLTGSPQAIQNNSATGLNLILGTGSGQFSVTARSDLLFEAATAVTLMPRATTQTVTGNTTYFGTFTDASSLALESVGGTLDFTNRSRLIEDSAPALSPRFDSQASDDQPGLHILAPTFAAIAFGGDLQVSGSVALWPSAHGNLDLLAAGSVQLNDAPILVSDVDPGMLPSANAVSQSIVENIDPILGLLDPRSPDGAATPSTPFLHAPLPVHGGAYASDGQPDRVPIRIVALTGDVALQPAANGTVSPIDVPKAIDIFAGKDIVNLDLNVQQDTSGDASSIVAGGNISYPFSRIFTGVLVPSNAAINVAGPGNFEIQAGGTINLGTSLGISSIGNIYNPALPAAGANLSVSAGITAPPHYQAFINTYLAEGSTYDQQLEQYMTATEGVQDPTKTQALALFEALPTAQQVPLIEEVLFDELRAGGRSAAAVGPTHDNFTRAFAALTTLYPGATDNRAAGQTVPYVGDLLLYFSRIYTLAGGDISLLAPGGQVNVGLAVPPSSFGITKGAADLGIVAQSAGSDNVLAYSDIQVNQSRVFAADGGNILMWSTFGNIDAGRGAKTAISAPPPVTTIDPNTGQTTTVFPPALQGSGIQTLASSPGVSPGDVDLFAPNGVVNANDAGIVAGNLTIAATAVLGSNNIAVSGSAVGLPPPAPALGALTASAGSSSTAASGSTQSGLESGGGNAAQAPHAAAELGWLEVFVLGLGEGQCKPDDQECLKREQQH